MAMTVNYTDSQDMSCQSAIDNERGLGLIGPHMKPSPFFSSSRVIVFGSRRQILNPELGS